MVWSLPPAVRQATLGSGVLLLGLFLPRLVALDTFFIQDERLWLSRSHHYIHTFAHGEFDALGEPPFSKHPGVTLMTVVGPAIASYAHEHGLTGNIEQWDVADIRRAAVWARVAAGTLSTILLVALFATLRRLPLFSRRPWWAAFTAVFLGVEPWVWGVSRAVHLDALLGLFLVLAIAAAALARVQRTTGRVMLSGCWWGLAFLTKTPALLVLPIAVLPFALRRPAAWREVVRDLLTWGVSALGTIMLFWPAMWLHPVARLRDLISRVLFHAGTPEPYLWPGVHPPLFVYVLSGTATIGVILYGVTRVRAFLHTRRILTEMLPADLLALGGLLFGLLLVYFQGDHARKNVPALALLAAAGAIGWLIATERLKASRWVALGVLVVHLGLALPWFPHLPSFHSPLFSSAEGNRLLVDNGNGMRLVADEVNRLDPPPIVATNLPGLLQPYLTADRRGRVRRLPESGHLTDLDGDVTHIVIPESTPARVLFDTTAKTLLAELEGKTPELTVRVRDIPLYSIYEVH